MTDQEIHRKLSVELFNAAWDLMEKPDRSREEDFRMLHCAHASRYHWECQDDCAPAHIARGEWQVSRVYIVLGRGEPALFHARRCLEICETNGIGDWDIAFAHESVARACAALGLTDECRVHQHKAAVQGAEIVAQDDRDYFFRDFHSGAWFGIPPE